MHAPLHQICRFYKHEEILLHQIDILCAKFLQSCLTLCDSMDYNPPGYSVHGVLQARILEWVAMLYSRDLPDPVTKPTFLMSPALAGGFFTTSTTWEAQCILQCNSTIYLFVIVQSLSCVWLFATTWTAARQASLSFTVSQSLLRFMSIKLMISSNHLILSLLKSRNVTLPTKVRIVKAMVFSIV